MGRRMSGRSRTSGFTLVEVVVALTLLSLILLGLVGAMRSFGQTSARLEAQTLAVDDLRLVGALLQRTIARASRTTYQDPADQAVRTWFAGGGAALAWLGQLPARHGAGGLSHLRLSVEEQTGGEGRGRLLLQMVPYAGARNPPDWGALEPRVLLDDVDALRLQYRGYGEAEWLDVWDDPRVLPRFVRIVVAVGGRSWPPIVVQLEQAAPRTDPGAAARSSPLRRF